MRAAIAARPTGGHLFVASSLAMLLSLATMGVITMALVWWVSEEATDLLTGVSAVLLGAFLGLVGGPTGSPISVITGTLLFLLFGRALAAHEFSTGVYRRLHWLAAGAVVGALVAAVMLLEHPLVPGAVLAMAHQRLPLYGPAIVTGMLGMLFWHAVIVALIGSEKRPAD